MVKNFHIKVTYSGETKLIACQKHEFPTKIAEIFNVNTSDVALFAVANNKRVLIRPQDIKDTMKIEMVPKRNEQRTLRNYVENDTSPSMQFDVIIEKLTLNSVLTGSERKTLIDFIKEHRSSSCCKKRKLNGSNNEVDLDPVRITPMCNKKVQVDWIKENTKESVAQTDPVNLVLDKSSDSPDVCHQMKILARDDNTNTEQAVQLMKKSFDERRMFIHLHSPPVSVVKERYELLFNTAEVRNELDRLNYPGKCKEFLKNMEMYAPIILNHIGKTDEIYQRMEKTIERVHTPQQKKYAQVVGSVFALAKLLEEEFRFIHLSDYPHGSADVYPYIDASLYEFKRLFFDSIMYHVNVEGIQLCDARDLPEAVLCLMAAFFIFNIQYPESCCRTLTAFEKLYLCASDTKDMDETTEQMIRYLQLQAQGRPRRN